MRCASWTMRPSESSCGASAADTSSSIGSCKTISRRISNPVHTLTYASWLNQIEIYFSIIQRKVLKPNDYTSLEELIEALRAFGRRYSALGKLFAWCFTLHHLERRSATGCSILRAGVDAVLFPAADRVAPCRSVVGIDVSEE